MTGGPGGALGPPHVYAIPLTTRFRGITVREGLVIPGAAGWGEFCPFPEYDDGTAAPWLAGAVEAATLGWPAPLAVAQILWIHLICDGPSDIVLGFEPKEAGIMDEKPKRRDEPILNRLSLSLIGIIALLLLALAVTLLVEAGRTFKAAGRPAAKS